MDRKIAFFAAQGISILTGILAIAMMQFKNMKLILLFQIIVNATAMTSYFLLGGDTGVFVTVFAIVQSVVMYLHNRSGKRPHAAVIVLFILAYGTCSAYNIAMTRSAMEILPACAAICFSVSLVQEKPSVFRIWSALNPALWLGYDLYTSSYVMLCVHFGILISSISAMIRLDGFLRLKKNSKENTK